MNKRIISLVLALVMVLGTFTSVFAAEETKKAEVKEETKAEKVEKVVGKDNKIQYIIDKKFVEGYEDGSYGYDKNIKRSEVTKLLVYANGNKELAERLQGSMQLYSDVNTENWANGVINVGSTVKSDANGLAMLIGYPDGTFKPENNVTYAELAKMLVVLAKEDLTEDMAKNAKWSADWMTWAAQLGILDDVTVANSDAPATRADAFTMIYNALYAMKEFKRVPANETRGIVSNLTNDKLTLNQDSEKEYTITGDTVIVDGDNNRSNYKVVRNLNRLDLYKGSLVRVLLNDKNEVTHILELGNPEKLALDNKNLKQADIEKEWAKVEDNNIWKGVADNTVRTQLYRNIETLDKKDIEKEVDGSYAKINLKSNKTKADKITFYENNKNNAESVTLKINDDTEVYVANPFNNIMKEVKDVNEALSLIGFRDYDNTFKIPNVYAGFDDDDDKAAVAGFDNAKNTAKVIVFNVVSKDNDGDRYRVIESSGSNYSTTLEDVDGKLYDRDNTLNKANFPLEYGDKLDVIEVRGDVIDTILDHSKTKDYPVVKVVEVRDNDNIVVEDRFENETKLYVGDADIFNAKQYKDLEKGDYLQFAMKDEDSRNANEDVYSRNANEDVDVVSILENNKDTKDLFDESGSVLNIVDGIEDHVVVGKVTRVGEDTMEVYIESDNWDAGINRTHRTYNIDKDYAEVLKVGDKIIFKIEDREYANHETAYDIRYNDGKNAPVINEETTGNIDAIKAAIKDLDAKYPDQESVNKDYENAKKATEAARKMINDLKFEDKAEWDKVEDMYNSALTNVEGFVTNKTAALKAEADADIKAVNEKVEAATNDVKVAKDTISADTALAKVKEVVEPVLEKGVTAKYKVTNLDTDAKTATVKVTLEKAPGDAQDVDVSVGEEA